jgi:hypothetical protein
MIKATKLHGRIQKESRIKKTQPDLTSVGMFRDGHSFSNEFIIRFWAHALPLKPEQDSKKIDKLIFKFMWKRKCIIVAKRISK